MYGLSADVDLQFIEGGTLIQACIGENEVVLRFDNDVSVMVASNVRLTHDGSSILIEDAREVGRRVTELLGDQITSAQGSPDGTTTLRWARGAVLDLLDTWDAYESYTITHGDAVIVV